MLKHCSRQHTHTPDGPVLLVWSCITLVCFALNGEPSSAWQFLPADIWQIFFCGSKTSRPDATGGGAPLVCLQEEHILLCCVPFLSCGCSEATLVLCHHPTRGHRALPRALSCPQQPWCSTGGCSQATHLTKPALLQQLGCGCMALLLCSSSGARGSRVNPPPSKDPKKQTALASGEMKLLKNSTFISQHHFLVLVLPHSTLKQKSKWWHCLYRKASPNQ